MRCPPFSAQASSCTGEASEFEVVKIKDNSTNNHELPPPKHLTCTSTQVKPNEKPSASVGSPPLGHLSHGSFSSIKSQFLASQKVEIHKETDIDERMSSLPHHHDGPIHRPPPPVFDVELQQTKANGQLEDETSPLPAIRSNDITQSVIQYLSESLDPTADTGRKTLRAENSKQLKVDESSPLLIHASNSPNQSPQQDPFVEVILPNQD
jgi:hypothetical protein